MKNLVIILPTYNEKENIESLINEIEETIKKVDKYKVKLLVVDDFSPDNTADVVTKLQKKHKNITLVSKKKEGLGAAYVHGMNYATHKMNAHILVEMDADWSHDPKLLPQFIKKIDSGADFVIGSRYISGGSIPNNWGLHRKIYSVIGNFIVRFGLWKLNPHDWTSGYRMMRSEVYEKVSKGLEKYAGYTFQIAFLHRAIRKKFIIDEVPLKFVDRVHGVSKIASFDYIRNVIIYVLNNSTFLKYLVVGVIGFLTQTIISTVLISLIKVKTFQGIAVGIGAFFAIVANFFGNNLWTFSHRKITSISKLAEKFIHFLGTSIGAVIIQTVTVHFGVLFTSISWFWWMVFSIIFLVIPYNFFVYSKFIWKHKK